MAAANKKETNKKAATTEKKKATPPAQPNRYARPTFTPFKTHDEAANSIIESASSISGMSEKFSKAPDSLTILNNAAKDLSERAAYIAYRSQFVDKQADKAAKAAERKVAALEAAKKKAEEANKRIAELEAKDKATPPAPAGKK